MSDLGINAVDIVVLAVLALSAIFAFMRGFVHEVLAIAAWLGAALATLYGFGHVQPYARQIVAIELLADILAGAAIFLVVLVVLSIFTRILSGRVQRSALGALDRSLGLAFGLLRGAVIVAVAWLAMTWAIPNPAERPELVQEAKTRQLAEAGAGVLASLVPAHLREEGETRAGAARNGAGRAGDLKDAYDLLPRLAPDPDAPEQAPGYREEQRQELERLMDSVTGADNEGG